MKKFFLIIFLSLLFINLRTVLFAQDSPEEIMEYFFQIFIDDSNKAIDYIFSTNSQIDINQPGIKSIKEGMETQRKLLGNYYGYDLVSKYYVGSVYAKYNYLFKYERQPVKVVIIFYKPDNKWKTQSLNIVADIESDYIRVE